MKNFLKPTLIAITAAITLCNCAQNNYTPEQIVGKYISVQTDETPATADDYASIVTVENQTEYLEDQTTKVDATLKMQFIVEEASTSKNKAYSNALTLEYRCTFDGNWELNGDYITEWANPRAMKLEFQKSSAHNWDQKMRQLEPHYKKAIAGLIPELKRDLAEKGSFKITSLDSTQMISDEDGVETIYTRIN